MAASAGKQGSKYNFSQAIENTVNAKEEKKSIGTEAPIATEAPVLKEIPVQKEITKTVKSHEESAKKETKVPKPEKKEKKVIVATADKPVTLNFFFAHNKKAERKTKNTMLLLRESTKAEANRLLKEYYNGESLNELVHELLDEWIEAHNK